MKEGKTGYKVVKHAASPKQPAPKPRNPVAKNANAAIGGGAAGAHKDKKKAQKQGEQKHKKRVPADMMEGRAYEKKLDLLLKIEKVRENIEEAKKGLYYYVNRRKKAGTSRSKSHPDAPSAQDWKDAAKTAKKENTDEASGYYNPMDYERDQQRQMDYDRRAFKRAELQHELGHEDDPDFERNFRQQQIDADRGPWYIRINGKIYRQKGVPKSFDWKSGAKKYGMAILKNNPSLAVQITKNPEDKEQGVAEGTEDLRNSVLAVLQDIYQGASAGENMIDRLADELNDYYRAIRASGDKNLQQVYRYMMDQGQEAESDPALMADIAAKAIKHLQGQDVTEAGSPAQQAAIAIAMKKAGKKPKSENFDPEYDDEAGMADNNLETLKRAVEGLDNLIGSGDNLPEWCQEKIAVAKSMLVTVWDYMESEGR